MGIARIAIVDDDSVSLEIMSRIAQSAGFDVNMFTNPSSALIWLQNNSCDLVVSDLEMVEMSGLDLFKNLKEVGKHQPFVLVTAYGDFRNLKEAWEEGVFDFIKKPIDSKYFIETVLLALEFGDQDYNRDAFKSKKSDSKFFSRAKETVNRRILENLVQALGVEVTEDIFSDFVRQLDEDYAVLLRAIDSQETQKFHRIIHKLRGSASNVGFTLAESKCVEIQNLFTVDWNQVKGHLTELETVIEEALKRSKEIIKNSNRDTD